MTVSETMRTSLLSQPHHDGSYVLEAPDELGGEATVRLRIPHASETDVILGLLSLIDVVFTGNLVLIVVLSGYENFVSRIDTANEKDTLGWLGKLDSGTLKLKVAASIVAISSIHLLRVFMKAESTDNDKIMWYVILHLTFVVSAVLLGVLDKMSFSAHREQTSEPRS